VGQQGQAGPGLDPPGHPERSVCTPALVGGLRCRVAPVVRNGERWRSPPPGPVTWRLGGKGQGAAAGGTGQSSPRRPGRPTGRGASGGVVPGIRGPKGEGRDFRGGGGGVGLDS
jgi:hypothetical protein